MNDFNLCLNNLFNKEDFKSNIKKKDIKKHKNKENAWVVLNTNVYSLKISDIKLLELFKDYYGKDIKNYLLEKFNNKDRILILNQLNKRKIGIIK